MRRQGDEQRSASIKVFRCDILAVRVTLERKIDQNTIDVIENKPLRKDLVALDRTRGLEMAHKWQCQCDRLIHDARVKSSRAVFPVVGSFSEEQREDSSDCDKANHEIATNAENDSKACLSSEVGFSNPEEADKTK